MTFKIVYGSDRSSLNEHARKMVLAIENHEAHNPRYTIPRGIPVYAARFPNTCDDCGATFWAADQYAVHPKCPGRQRTGFGT